MDDAHQAVPPSTAAHQAAPPSTADAAAAATAVMDNTSTSTSTSTAAAAADDDDDRLVALDLNTSPRASTTTAAAAAIAAASLSSPPSTSPSRSSSSSSSAVAQLEVEVGDASTSGDGLHAFVQYTVWSRRVLASGAHRQHTVARRYSDFVWLRGALQAAFAGVVVAPLPNKAVLRRFTADFIERRRRGLAAFLQRVARHRVLCAARALDVFLTASERELDVFRAAKPPAAAAAAIPPPSGWLGVLASLSSTVHNTLNTGDSAAIGGGGGATSGVKTDADLRVDAAQEYAAQLQRSLASCRSRAAAVVRGHQDCGSAWFEFGLAITLLGQFEAKKEPANEATLGAALTQIGRCADRVSVLLSDLTDTETNALLEPLSDYCRLVEALQEMLKGRDTVLAAKRSADANLAAKRAKLDAARAKGREDKAEALEPGVAEAERISNVATERLLLVDRSVSDELEQFRAEKRQDIHAMLLAFVQLQVQHCEKMCATWTSVLGEIQRR